MSFEGHSLFVQGVDGTWLALPAGVRFSMNFGPGGIASRASLNHRLLALMPPASTAITDGKPQINADFSEIVV